MLFDGIYEPAEELDRADPAAFTLCQVVLAGFREMDFWLGSWTAVAAPGTQAGTAEVRADLNGCLLQQDFVGKNGYRSRSFLFWDFAEDRRFRTLADNTGGYLQLSGNLDGERMVLTGTDQGPDGASFQVRNTLAPEGSGVLETWQVSRDGGATWKEAMNLRYVPR